jgi:Aspartyl protease
MMRQVCWAFTWCVLSFASFFLVSAESQAATKRYIEVPFDFTHGVIIMQVAVNGLGPLQMLLDTGVDPSVVDLGSAKRIGLKLANQGERGSGLGNDLNLFYGTELERVQVGALTAMHVDAAAIDLSKVSARLGQPIDGVLGYSLLRGRIVQIDYSKRRVRFFNVAPRCTGLQLRKSHCSEFSFAYKEEILASGVTVDGQPVIANFDTGSDSLLEIRPSTIERLGLRDNAMRGHPSSATGFNGEAKNSEGTVQNLGVGSFSLDQPTTVFYNEGNGVDDEPWEVRLGNAFMKDFIVTIDFSHNRIILVGQKAFPN